MPKKSSSLTWATARGQQRKSEHILLSWAIKNKKSFWDQSTEQEKCRFSRVCNRYRKKALKSPFILNSLGLNLFQSQHRVASIPRKFCNPWNLSFHTCLLRGESQVENQRNVVKSFNRNKDDDYINFIVIASSCAGMLLVPMCANDMGASLICHTFNFETYSFWKVEPSR